MVNPCRSMMWKDSGHPPPGCPSSGARRSGPGEGAGYFAVAAVLEQPPERETQGAPEGIEESRLIDARCRARGVVNILVCIEHVVQRQRQARAARPGLAHEALLQVGDQPDVEGCER